MTTDNWLLLVGPSVAVGIFFLGTWWNQHTRLIQERKNTFFSLCQWRKVPAIDKEYMNAINSIPKFFSNDTNVMELWKRVMSSLIDMPPNSQANDSYLTLHNEKVMDLLEGLAKASNIKMPRSAIEGIGYVPMWYVNKQLAPAKVVIVNENGVVTGQVKPIQVVIVNENDTAESSLTEKV